MNNALSRIVILGLSLFVASASISKAHAQIATTPSPAQIAQFKNLPKSQQVALAKQFGIDLESLTSGQGSSQQQSTVKPEEQYLQNNSSAVENALNASKSNKRIKENELKPFGYEMFERLQDAFLPEGNIPVPSDYIVGPGDTIQINLFGKESNQYNLTVDNAGQIIIPSLEPISVSGLNFSELKQYITNTVKTKMIGISASVTLTNLRGIQVYVVGDVKNPGAYHLSSLSTLTNALFISGGPNGVGSLRDIQLKRGNKTIARLDLYKMFTQGDVSQDKRLQQGDVVFVGTIQKQVAISGEVRRPAIYEVFGNETVSDLIVMAGGLNVNAYPKHAILARFDENYQRDVQRIDLNDEAVNSQKLKNGDVLTVLPVSDRLDQVVNVAGSVSRPTTYAWSEGMTLSDLIVNKDDLMETTDLNYGLILTQQPSGNYEVIQFKPKDVLAGESEELNPGDLVVFFNRYNQATFAKTAPEEEFGMGSSLKEEGRRFGKIDEVFDTEYDLTETETTKYNYLYAIQNGSLFDKQDALLATKSLSREDLIRPIVKLLSSSSEAGELIPVVSLTGQVRFPGVYPIGHKARLSDIISAGGGLTESANLTAGEISRVVQDASDYVTVEHLNFNLVGALAGVKEEDLVLEPRDVVNVFQQANWNDELKITIEGEVKYPGEYTVKEGETLTEVLARAGGVTKFAALDAAFYTRLALKELERKQAQNMARALSKELALKSMSSSMSNLNVNEVQTLVANLSEVEGVGRLVINLPAIMDGITQDIQLENGDALYIPPQRNEINVIGEVQVSTSHVYRDDWTATKYIESSGGLRAQADEDRVYIIRANGLVDIPNLSQWFGTDKREYLNPGDTVVVPLDAGYTDKLTLWEKATAIFYQMTVGLAALGRL